MLTPYRGPWQNSCALAITLEYGSQKEQAAMRGYTHLGEHLMFCATDKHSSEELQVAVDTLMNSLEATTSRKSVRMWTQFHADHTEKVIDLLEQMVFHWQCPTNEIPQQREMLLEEWEDFSETEDRKILDQMHRLMGISSSVPLGERDWIETIDAKEIAKVQKHWQQNVLNAPRSVVAVGNFSPESLRRIQALFSLENTEKPSKTWEISSCKLVIDKKFAGLLHQTNSENPLTMILDGIYYWRWKKQHAFTLYRMYDLDLHTGFFLCNKTPISRAQAEEFFFKDITTGEFQFVKESLMRYWQGVFDVVNYDDALEWLEGFNLKHYGPWGIHSPEDAYQFLQNASIEEVQNFHQQLIKG